MNNKGFTLIELISVLAILGLVGTVFTISLNYTLKKNQQNECNNFIKEVEESACAYAGVHCTKNNCDSVTLGTLIKYGYITKEVNACNNNPIESEDIVTITWNINGEKICKYDVVMDK